MLPPLNTDMEKRIMFVFNHAKELEIITELVNRQLFKICPELKFEPEIAKDCLNIYLVNINLKKNVTVACLRNANENCIMVGVRYFYLNIMRDFRAKSIKTIANDFDNILNSIYRRFD